MCNDEYGKGFIKKCRVSPDGWVQMAMQLAYFKDAKQFAPTYESSMTRLFREGRTETVRPVSEQSVAFVRAMLDTNATDDQRVSLLREAVARHQQTYRDAMVGKGVDRHLFALYVVSVGKKIDSPFLKQALSAPWRLSTSQQPQQQTNRWDLRKPEHAARVSPGGGFGPVADDGYGVSYMVPTETKMFFHVSSKKSSNATDSKRFAGLIMESLREMKEMFERVHKAKAAK